MAIYQHPVTIATNELAPFDQIIANAEYNRPGVIQTLNLEFVAGAAGAPTFSAQPQQGSSNTGPWYNIGSAITTAAPTPTSIQVVMPFFRLHVPTLSAGGLTVVVS